MPNIENFMAFPHWQYELVRHLLQLTVASFAAGFVYFLATSREVELRAIGVSFGARYQGSTARR